jgi:hypothetical protein
MTDELPDPPNCHGAPDQHPAPFTEDHWRKWGHDFLTPHSRGWFQQAYQGQTREDAKARESE